MTILADIPEVAERFEELVDLARRNDEVVICRAGRPVAVLTPIPKPGQGTRDDFLPLAAAGRPANGDQTSNHNYFYDDNGLSK
ncbi:prevent-host-death family protein [Rhizobium aethiopicum]|uniref:type II toxin-antitoxin system Phd/YefM family antitoxin n=1 Tax=Rhizobium aethiopicum TaxID=1138170 RepID=UPI00160895E5|nr:type II toxin-antitoxin system prevent-host-death family antitoxin [Rhizobium aethiopicum]MBB4581526.1 prevent-host-death family protein [Rhizobium aethiopicum]